MSQFHNFRSIFKPWLHIPETENCSIVFENTTSEHQKLRKKKQAGAELCQAQTSLS